jgi:hypothetical protein
MVAICGFVNGFGAVKTVRNVIQKYSLLVDLLDIPIMLVNNFGIDG